MTQISAYTGFIQKAMHVPRHKAGMLLIALAAGVYGAFGAPTPDTMGIVEWGIGGAFLLAFVLSGPWEILNARRWDVGKIFLFFGLSVPLIVGVCFGNAPGSMLRDIIPFLFMMMPVLYAALLRSDDQKILLLSVLVIGILFSLRSVLHLPFLGSSSPLDYMANMPSVLMTAIFFAGFGVAVLCERFDLKALVIAPVLFALSALCLWPVAETLQRASVGVYIFCVVGVLAFYLVRSPRRALLVIALGVAAFVLFGGNLTGAYEALAEKNMLVGSNMRFAELAAVWQKISGNSVSVLFGYGWGAEYASPAVAGITVNYTHSLLSALILKTGIVGLVLGVFYLGALGRVLLRAFPVAPVLVLALAGPIAIDVLLYASYKSLDFGLVLMLAAGMDRFKNASPIASV